MTDETEKTELALMSQKLDGVVLEQKETKKEISHISKVLGKIAIQQNDIKTLYRRSDVLYQQREKDFGEGGVIDKIKTRQAACPVKENDKIASKKDIEALWFVLKWAIGVGCTAVIIIISVLGIILKGHL